MTIDNHFESLTGNRQGCAYKWAWSTVVLNRGITSSCHRTTPDEIDHTTVANFHNTPTKIKTRQLMQNGQWPGHGCEYCKEIEAAGGISDRMEANSAFMGNLIPKELKQNPNTLHTTPTIVEATFSNLCNMSCIYCDEGWSSVWEQENRKFNSNLTATNKIMSAESYKLIVDNFFKWLETNISNLSNFHILGGEPFIMPEFDRVLDLLSSTSNPNLEITVITNLKIPHEKFKQQIVALNNLLDRGNLKSVRIVASLDCWGPEQVYIRTGLYLPLWEKNFAYMVTTHQNLRINVHSTVTGLSIKTMYYLIEKINYYSSLMTNNRIIHSKNFVVDPACLSPKIFPRGFFDSDFDNIMSIITNETELNEMNGYRLAIDAGAYDKTLIIELKSFLDTLDFRRNTNWRTVFPWLDQFDVDKYHS